VNQKDIIGLSLISLQIDDAPVGLITGMVRQIFLTVIPRMLLHLVFHAFSNTVKQVFYSVYLLLVSIDRVEIENNFIFALLNWDFWARYLDTLDKLII
jgi:hypothetical protein